MGIKVSVVVPTYNRPHLLERCLDSLLNQSFPKDRYEVVMVDDGSEERLEGWAPTDKPRVKYIRQAHGGPARARNRGIKDAEGEIVAFIDDDCIADEDWLKNVVECFTDNVAGVEGRIVASEKTPFSHYVENLKGGSYITANIAYKKQILEEVGSFDETYPYPASEDFELAFRILQRNYKIAFCKDAVVLHPPIKENLREYFKTRKYWFSTISLYRKHPEMAKKRHGSILNLILFYMLLYPFVELNKWKGYLLKHPGEVPRFVIKLFLNSSYATYVLISYLIDLFFGGGRN